MPGGVGGVSLRSGPLSRFRRRWRRCEVAHPEQTSPATSASFTGANLDLTLTRHLTPRRGDEDQDEDDENQERDENLTDENLTDDENQVKTVESN